MAEIFTVETRGVGRPDYSQEIARGEVRAGIRLKENQQVVVFVAVLQDVVAPPSPIAWVQPPLAIGGSLSLYDANTGISGPYTVPQGFVLREVQEGWTFDQDIELWLYYDAVLIACFGIDGGGKTHYANPVFGVSTELFDPIGATAHSVEAVLVNRGGGVMEGAITIATVLEAVGTPPFPDTKPVKCPFCGNQQVVPVTTTTIKCAKCGETFMVYNTSHMGRR